MIISEVIHIGDFCDYNQFDDVKNFIDKEIIPKLKSLGVLYGELYTPTSISDISMRNISHAITDMSMQNNYLIFNYKILRTPKGNEVKSLIEDNFNFKIIPDIIYNGSHIAFIRFDMGEGISINYREHQLTKLLGE